MNKNQTKQIMPLNEISYAKIHFNYDQYQFTRNTKVMKKNG